jgi:hypothetical protein
MPYILVKCKNGYKLCKRDEPKKCFSKNPISLSQAKKQRQAIAISERKYAKR